jgi:hypothetical protein
MSAAGIEWEDENDVGDVNIMVIVDSDKEDLATAHSKLSAEGVIDLTED